MPRLLGFIEDAGAVAGIVSFLAVSVLLVLYLAKARELRQLRRRAPFLAEGNGRARSARSPARRRTARTR